MKRKTVKRLLIIILSLFLITAISVGIFLIHMLYGNWWDRPDFGKDIDRIEIYDGINFEPPGAEKTTLMVLDAESQEGKKLIRSLERGWYYWNPVKLAVTYSVTIVHSDGRKDDVEVSRNFISVRLSDDSPRRVYRTFRNIPEHINQQPIK